MAENDVKATVILEADKASAAATKRLLAGISDDVKDLGTASSRAAVGATALQKELGKMSRAEHLKQIATEMGALANKTKDTAAAVADLDKKLKAVGANDDEIRGAAGAFQSAANAPNAVAPTGGLAGFGALLAKRGSQVRNLPSTQIPGLPIATDAIGNLLRVAGAITQAAAAAKGSAAVTAAASTVATAAQGTQAAAAGTVTVTSTSAAAGMLALAVAAAPIAAIGAVIAAGFILIKGAMDAFSASAAENAAKVTRAYEASDSVFDAILNGSTSEEARKKVEQEQLKKDEADRQFAIAFQQSQERYAEIAAKYGVAAAEIAKNRGTDEFNLFADRMKEQKELSAQATANMEGFNQALKDNKFAAADAKEAEEKRKEEQEKLDREAKAEAEKHARELEQVQERIVDSNRKFAQKQEDDAKQAANKLEDIERNARDKRTDLALKYNDDLVKIALDARRDEADAQLKIQQAEADATTKNRQAETDAVLKQQRTLEDIRKDALRNETDQLRQRNFLGAALASEAAQESVEESNKAAERESQDRAIQAQRDADERNQNYQREAAERYQALNRARTDRMTAYQTEQRDAVTAYNRAIRDAQIAQERQEEQTLLGYEREQAQLQEHQNKLLGIAAEGQAAERALKSGQDVALRNSNTTNNNGNQTNVNDYRAMTFNAGSMGGLSTIEAFRRIALQVQSATRYG